MAVATKRTGAKAPNMDAPFVLVEPQHSGLRIVAANAAALAANVTPGLSFTDACARVPDLASEPIDRASDAATLNRLAHWMGRYSPRVAIGSVDTLVLDTTGCDHLFGGEATMAATIGAALEGFGLTHRIGFASTPGAAWALAHGAPQTPISIAQGELCDGLTDLPITALRLSPETCQLLRRFGLIRIGQLYDIDRKALARRFASRDAADAVLLRLDQALGRRHETFAPLVPPADYQARLACPDPLLHGAGVHAGLEQLLADLAAQLEDHGRGARRFALKAFRSDGTVSSVSIRTARTVRDSAHIKRLFNEEIDQIDPGFGIDLLVLDACDVDSMEVAAPALSGDLAGTPVDGAALSALADRLMARLGPDCVHVVAPQARYLPEHAERRQAFTGHLPSWSDTAAPFGPRPIRLLPRPEPIDVLAEVPEGPPLRFVWRRVTRRVTRADGPERIAPAWWCDQPTSLPTPLPVHIEGEQTPASSHKRARDYYRVEDEAGRRYWLFRDGLYEDGRGGPPAWYLHGQFA